jgi:hypothetical protein
MCMYFGIWIGNDKTDSYDLIRRRREQQGRGAEILGLALGTDFSSSRRYFDFYYLHLQLLNSHQPHRETSLQNTKLSYAPSQRTIEKRNMNLRAKKCPLHRLPLIILTHSLSNYNRLFVPLLFFFAHHKEIRGIYYISS